MSIVFKPAVRQKVSLILGLAGASGSGKTRSALEVARGLADGDDTAIAGIDTEAGRMQHYAVKPGERPGPGRFAFQTAELNAPFTPESYIDAIEVADRAGFKVIVVDSFSHEWEGEGGLHDIQEDELKAMLAKGEANAKRWNKHFDEAFQRDKLSASAWKEPKKRHKRLVGRLLQCRAHIIICLRAEEKLIIEQVEENGRTKTVYTQTKNLPEAKRWIPICEKRLMFEMTASFVLSPDTPGIPYPIKLQEQHAYAVPLDQQLSTDAGMKLAAWARGGEPVKEPPAPKLSRREQLHSLAREKAKQGAEALGQWRSRLRPDDNDTVEEIAAELAPPPKPAKPLGLDAEALERTKAGVAAFSQWWNELPEPDQDRLSDKYGDALFGYAREADEKNKAPLNLGAL